MATCILYHSSIEHLGLLNDIKDDVAYILCMTKLKQINNPVKKIIRKIHISEKVNKIVRFPGKYKWYTYGELLKSIECIEHIIVFNGALNNLDLDYLKACKRKKPSVRISLYLIDSMNAESPMLQQAKHRINQYEWDKIYTFDPIDAKLYGWIYAGFNYYSMLQTLDPMIATDVYFIGGTKGHRYPLIKDLFQVLTEKGVNCNFWVMPYENVEKMEGLHYIEDGWIPYEAIINGVKESKCIIEILQEGQYGASLRYFEAVCYNKKLITNNPYIIHFPFYNPDFMKVISKVEDIDVEWILADMDVEYNYNNEFSPSKLSVL